jgi:hypothetical protein
MSETAGNGYSGVMFPSRRRGAIAGIGDTFAAAAR